MTKKNMFKQLSITSYFKSFSKSDITSVNKLGDSDKLSDIKIDSYDDKAYNYIINVNSIVNKNIRGYNKDTGNWHCLECGENMGDNPRQLCGKSMCLYS